MPVPFFDLSRQTAALKKELDAAIGAVVSSSRFILGENVAALEKELAASIGVKHAVGVASGTDALHLALLACGVKPGDEVITTPFTFVATAEAISYCGAKPVFVDIEPNSFNINPTKIEEKLTTKTRAILPVHLYGLPADMSKLMAIAKKHSLKVVEDCAQSIGSAFMGQKTGSFGAAAAFSFFPTKNLGCFGDGGMVLTDNPEIADELKVLRGHGSRVTYHYDLIGFNSRLDELQAAILRVKLPHLAEWTKKRQANAKIYTRLLGDISQITLPASPDNCRHAYNQFTLRTEQRDALFEHLKNEKIGAMVYYPLSLHLQKAFSFLGYRPGDFPESEKAQREVLSLPIFPEATSAEIEAAANAVRKFFLR